MTPSRSYLRRRRIASSLAAALTLGLATAAASDDPFDDDSLWNLPQADNKRGTLNFLGEPTDERMHHHQNQITLAASSLKDGWVGLRQCHHDIDRVGRAQILYNAATTRDLEIETHSNIGETWIEGASVQLRSVQPDAEICVRARSRMLEMKEDGGYVLENGPFMRRFLDGYFPMRVTVAVSWGDLGLSLAHSEPLAQPGFTVTESPYGVIIDTTFEGRLRTALHLTNDDRP